MNYCTCLLGCVAFHQVVSWLQHLRPSTVPEEEIICFQGLSLEGSLSELCELKSVFHERSFIPCTYPAISITCVFNCAWDGDKVWFHLGCVLDWWNGFGWLRSFEPVISSLLMEGSGVFWNVLMKYLGLCFMKHPHQLSRHNLVRYLWSVSHFRWDQIELLWSNILISYNKKWTSGQLFGGQTGVSVPVYYSMQNQMRDSFSMKWTFWCNFVM